MQGPARPRARRTGPASAGRRTAHRTPFEPRAADPSCPVKMFHMKHLFLLLFGAARPDGRNASRAPPGILPPPNRRETPGPGVSAPPRAASNASCKTDPASNRHDARKGFPARLRPDREHPNRVIPCETKREERMQLFGHCAPMRPSRRESVQFSPRCCSSAASKTRSRPRSARRPGETFAIGKAGEPEEPAYVTFR